MMLCVGGACIVYVHVFRVVAFTFTILTSIFFDLHLFPIQAYLPGWYLPLFIQYTIT